MTRTSSVTLMGERIQVAELRRLRSSGDARIERLVHHQLLADVNAESAHSEGLVAVNVLWRTPISQRVIGAYIPDEFGQDEVWNITLEMIVARVNTFDPNRSRFSTWVFNQAKYASLNELRRRNRIRRIDESATSQPLEESAFVESSFSDREKRATRDALKQMTLSERELIRQRLILDLSYDEMFEALGGSIKREHLRVYVARAIVKLKKLVNEELERR